MHAKDGFHFELLKQTVFDHFAGAAAAFFGGLENGVHRAVKVAVLGQVLRSGQQHGGVAVVAASVHLARVAAGMGEGVELLHGQGVDVGAQANAATAGTAIAPVDDAHHAGGAHAAVNRDAPIG